MERYAVSDERMVRLETQRENDQADIADLKTKVDEIHADVQIIKQGIEKQKGFLAGMMFILLPIWSGITAAAIAFWDKLSLGGH
jgi:hypothetical protein